MVTKISAYQICAKPGLYGHREWLVPPFVGNSASVALDTECQCGPF